MYCKCIIVLYLNVTYFAVKNSFFSNRAQKCIQSLGSIHPVDTISGSKTYIVIIKPTLSFGNNVAKKLCKFYHAFIISKYFLSKSHIIFFLYFWLSQQLPKYWEKYSGKIGLLKLIFVKKRPFWFGVTMVGCHHKNSYNLTW